MKHFRIRNSLVAIALLGVVLYLPQLAYGYKLSQGYSSTQLSNPSICGKIREGLEIPEVSLEKEFAYLGEQLLLQSKDIKNLPFRYEQLEKIIQATFIIGLPEDKVMLNGKIVDVINEPAKNLIAVNENSWRKKNLLAKLELVLHEYFGMLGIEKNVYGQSFVAQPLIKATHRALTEKGLYAIYPFTVIARAGTFYICKKNKPEAIILRYGIVGNPAQFAEAFTTMLYLGAYEDDPMDASFSEISIGHYKYLNFRDKMIEPINYTFNFYEQKGYPFVTSALLTEHVICPKLKAEKPFKNVKCYLDMTEEEILTFDAILSQK